MAEYIYWNFARRRSIRRNRIFRDRTHPLEVFDDEEIYRKFRFPREEIIALTDIVKNDIEHVAQRRGSLTPVLQMLLTLRFYATGTFQDTVAELIGVDQSTASRTIARVTDALVVKAREWICLPSQRDADRTKEKFFSMQGLPHVIGCIDGTHVRIQAPREYEHEFVNRKNFHSINVQVICDADLIFINAVAKWPGSVHDARILRQSAVFADFEGNQPTLDGVILGDSGYMLRTWLLTPVLSPTTTQQRKYNEAHSSTRTTVERSIGVAKQRWHCLRCGLRLQPAKACKVIIACLALHNFARRRKIGLPPTVDNSDPEDEGMGDTLDDTAEHTTMNERARLAAGKQVRDGIISSFSEV